MSIDVDITREMVSDRRRFELRVRFRSDARRTVIYGPSGAGKSLTLKAIAGLLTPDTGHVRIGSETLFDQGGAIDVPARRRRLGYVFQDYALFPHLNVRQNIAFGLSDRWFNPGPQIAHAGVERALRAFGLAEMANQRPAELSGGQRQRTALARALANSPRALLLDEPFSALDPDLRSRMRDELDALLDEVGIPVVMITHDREDMARFGECVVHVRDGLVVEPDCATASR